MVADTAPIGAMDDVSRKQARKITKIRTLSVTFNSRQVAKISEEQGGYRVLMYYGVIIGLRWAEAGSTRGGGAGPAVLLSLIPPRCTGLDGWEFLQLNQIEHTPFSVLRTQ